MGTIENTTGLEQFIDNSPPSNLRISATEKKPGGTGELSFFGKDGFTFFDFLDIINPLQHIPIISNIYRSLTGDQIDPGSRIAGGTIFGGPIGAALASVDVAIKHHTGRDIAEHTSAFFVGETTNKQANLNSKPTTSNPPEFKSAFFQPVLPNIATNHHPVELVKPNSVGFSRKSEVLRPNRIEPAPKQLYAAGMTAIPVIKKSYATPLVPDLNLYRLGATTPPLYNSTPSKPSAHTSDPDTRFNLAAKTKNNDPRQIAANNANAWVIDAMLRGLNKYDSAMLLKAPPQKPILSATR